MVASEFLGYIQAFSAVSYVGVEDLADRANFQWNVIVLLTCMIFVTTRQYFMTPLVCYIPNPPSGINADSYITNLCWVEGTFPLNQTSNAVPHDANEWSSKNPRIMNYYQWVPLVLGLQAILYSIPKMMWSLFTYNSTGTDLQNMIKTASTASKDGGEKRDKAVHHVAKSLELMFFSRREYHDRRSGRLGWIMNALPGKRRGKNLIYYYIFIKLLYCVIGAVQIHIMYAFLRFDQKEGYFFFGWRILDDVVQGRAWAETQVFPRVSACRQTIQNVGAVNKIFAQCVLAINMLNEKMYIFLYFFLTSVMVLSVLSVPLWIYRIAKFRQRHFIKRFLKMADIYNRDDKQLKDLIDRFINEFLRQDGHFLLRMLSMNAGDLITVEIVCCLFGNYRKLFFGKDFRGVLVVKRKGNEYGDPQNGQDTPLKGLPYPSGHGDDGGFMSVKLQPGGYASSKQRPLPTAPPEDSSYPLNEEASQKAPMSSPYPKLPDYADSDDRLSTVRSTETSTNRRGQNAAAAPPPPPPHLFSVGASSHDLESSNV